MRPYISQLNLKGFKAFRDTTFTFGSLEVIVGANGSGKTSLFEFLRFLRDAVDREIPPEIIRGGTGQRIFYNSLNSFQWKSTFRNIWDSPPQYRGEVGRSGIVFFEEPSNFDTDVTQLSDLV